MCEHRYSLDPQAATASLRCPYPELYAQLRDQITSRRKSTGTDLDLELPLDRVGFCVFHSRDIDWKRQQRFVERFQELLELLDLAGEGVPYDFREFVFVGERVGRGKEPDSLVLQIADRVFSKKTIFSGAYFFDRTVLKSVKFTGRHGAFFIGTSFKDILEMEDVFFSGVDFSQSVFDHRVIFRRTDFAGQYALFEDCRFERGAMFLRASFEGIAEFLGAYFGTRDGNEAVAFDDVDFSWFANFSRSVFDTSVSFERVIFKHKAEFIDAAFNVVVSASRYRVAAASFYDIEVDQDAEVVFRSTDVHDKMFKSDVRFRFKGDPKGVVKFENVNFINIDEQSRDQLTQLSKAGHVEIGPGCIKYRLQTEVRTITIDGGNQPLVLELAQTFANYFSVKNRFNLGLEIVERNSREVRFFYFTDEDITQAEFLERLTETEVDLWSLLSTRIGVERLITDGEPDAALVASNENVIINTVDGISALLGTLFRVGVRIAFGRWKLRDTEALVDVANAAGQRRAIAAGGLHQALITHYSSAPLLGFNAKQNNNLELLGAKDQNLRLISGGKSALEVAHSRELVTENRRILFLSSVAAGTGPLSLGRELNEIETNLKASKERERLEFRKEHFLTVGKCTQAILDFSPHIVHFSGHGEEGGLYFEDAYGSPELVPAEALADLFELFRDTVQCVVLAACYSEKTALEIRKYIPHVIGVSIYIPSDAAILFSTGFYMAIGAGRDIPFAFELGRVMSKLHGIQKEEMLKLY